MDNLPLIERSRLGGKRTRLQVFCFGLAMLADALTVILTVAQYEGRFWETIMDKYLSKSGSTPWD